MNIEIDDGSAGDEAFAAQRLNRDRNVVKHAETRALGPECVVSASGQAARNAAFHRHAGAAQSTTCRGKCPIHQPLGPGKSDAPHGSRLNASIEERRDVFGIMGKLDGVNGCERRGAQIEEPGGLQPLADEPVFPDREFVSGRKKDLVLVAVVDAQPHQRFERSRR